MTDGPEREITDASMGKPAGGSWLDAWRDIDRSLAKEVGRLSGIDLLITYLAEADGTSLSPGQQRILERMNTSCDRWFQRYGPAIGRGHQVLDRITDITQRFLGIPYSERKR